MSSFNILNVPASTNFFYSTYRSEVCCFSKNSSMRPKSAYHMKKKLFSGRKMTAHGYLSEFLQLKRQQYISASD
jgi:hypothetical protein